MKKVIILGLAMAVAIWTAEASDRRHSVNVTTDDNTSSDDCSVRLRVSSSDFGATYRDETTTAVSNQPLPIRGERNGGIQVTTWDQPQFSIKLCKQVASDNESAARRILQETKLQINGGDISVSSPESSDDYSLGTLILVKAPRGATVSLSVHNGGISLRKFDGTAEAHTMNGGIALNQSTGKLTVVAQIWRSSNKNRSRFVSRGHSRDLFLFLLPDHLYLTFYSHACTRRNSCSHGPARCASKVQSRHARSSGDGRPPYPSRVPQASAGHGPCWAGSDRRIEESVTFQRCHPQRACCAVPGRAACQRRSVRSFRAHRRAVLSGVSG